MIVRENVETEILNKGFHINCKDMMLNSEKLELMIFQYS